MLCTDLPPSLSPAPLLFSSALDQGKDWISLPVLLPCNTREQISFFHISPLHKSGILSSLGCSTYAQVAIKVHLRATGFILSFIYEYQSLTST